MRTPLYAANWKMHKTVDEARGFFAVFNNAIDGIENADVLIAPPFTSLAACVAATENTVITIAAQNCHYEKQGAYTGEINLDMIQESGAGAVILGHSERRHLFGESDEMINKKIIATLSSGLKPVFCIGEKLEQREAGETVSVCVTQIREGLTGVTPSQAREIDVAYEPVWAIGTGKTATPDIAQEAHEAVRTELSNLFGSETADSMRILYGGSVKPGNIDGLMEKQDIDGVLVGGASLDPESFAAICMHGQ